MILTAFSLTHIHSCSLAHSGLCFKQLENLNMALQKFKQAYKLMPSSLDVLYQMGDMLSACCMYLSGSLIVVFYVCSNDMLYDKETETKPSDEVDTECLEKAKVSCLS